MINQCIIQAQVTLEVLAERYAEAGIPHILVEGEDPEDILKCYVKNGEVAYRPLVILAGENRVIRADGVDTLVFSVLPTNVKVEVVFNDTLVHEESVTDGTVEFSTTLAGTYTIIVSSDFPYLGSSVVVEAA